MNAKGHIGVHGSGNYMVIAFEENSREEYVDTGGLYRRVLFLGFARNDDHASLRQFALKHPETAHLYYAPLSANRWQIPEDETAPFVRLGEDWQSGWSVRARVSTYGLEPETKCGLCGWSPYEEEQEQAGE